jgi:hypothetical protein
MISSEIEALEHRVRHLEKILARVAGIEEMADIAIDLFIKKAHDLKKIDSKRDDVINLLCQKLSELEKRVNKED